MVPLETVPLTRLHPTLPKASPVMDALPPETRPRTGARPAARHSSQPPGMSRQPFRSLSEPIPPSLSEPCPGLVRAFSGPIPSLSGPFQDSPYLSGPFQAFPNLSGHFQTFPDISGHFLTFPILFRAFSWLIPGLSRPFLAMSPRPRQGGHAASRLPGASAAASASPRTRRAPLPEAVREGGPLARPLAADGPATVPAGEKNIFSSSRRCLKGISQDAASRRFPPKRLSLRAVSWGCPEAQTRRGRNLSSRPGIRDLQRETAAPAPLGPGTSPAPAACRDGPKRTPAEACGPSPAFRHRQPGSDAGRRRPGRQSRSKAATAREVRAVSATAPGSRFPANLVRPSPRGLPSPRCRHRPRRSPRPRSSRCSRGRHRPPGPPCPRGPAPPASWSRGPPAAP